MYRKGITKVEEADFRYSEFRDVQILLNGSEMWEYADRADLAVKTPYDPEADTSGFPGVETEFDEIRERCIWFIRCGHTCCGKGQTVIEGCCEDKNR